MELHPAIATDLLFDGYQGRVECFPQYWAVTLPEQPECQFGNYLLLDHPPTEYDRDWLERAFDQLIGSNPLIRHRTFLWSHTHDNPLQLGSFVSAGYRYMECLALALQRGQLRAPSGLAPLPIRPFEPADWSDWLAFELAEHPSSRQRPAYQHYLQARAHLYQSMIADGLGQWWGMWQDDLLVASCGLFFTPEHGRFQLVRTREGWRNRGLCRHLLHEVARRGLERVDTLVIVADIHYHALGIYRRLGFEPTTRIATLCRAWK